MKFRGLIIAVVVLLALGGLLYWSNRRKPSEQPSPASSNPSPAILKLDEPAIFQLTLTRKGDAPIILVKGSSDTWTISTPKDFRADQDAVSGMLSTLSNLSADRVVEEKAFDLKPFGLADPSVTVDIETTDHRDRKLLLGDNTPAGSDVYAMLAADPRIFTIAGYSKTSLDKSLDDVRDKKLFDFGFDEPDKIELHQGAASWLFTHTGNDWWSNGKKMDSAAVESLVGTLRDLTATGFPDSGFSSPELEVTVISGGGKRVEKVAISKSADNYIGKRENAPSLYRLGSTAVTGLVAAADAVKPAALPAK
jgi:hypothetical protein